MINGVVGVIIWTEDLERLLTFYQRLLSCEPYSIRPDFVWFKWGSMRFGIGKHSEVVGKAIDPVRIFINLGVDEIHSEYDRLLLKGVTFIRKPEKEHWGGWVSTLVDPDNNIVQLIQQRVENND